MCNENIDQIISILENTYPQADCSLVYKDAWHLLVAGILAAQCTDKRVNMITPVLFDKYPTVYDMMKANKEDVSDIIHSAGFYNTKSVAIIACADKIVNYFGGKVPETIEELITLPGVGRKIANLIVGDVFLQPSYVIDTHAKRLLKRLGFTESDNPDVIEIQMRLIVPQEKSTRFFHMLVDHGRAICDAKKPKCDSCTLKTLCFRGSAVKDTEGNIDAK